MNDSGVKRRRQGIAAGGGGGRRSRATVSIGLLLGVGSASYTGAQSSDGHQQAAARPALAERRQEADLRARLRVDPNDAISARRLSDLLTGDRRVEEAHALLHSLAERDGATPQIEVVFGEFLLQQKIYPEALDAFETALDGDGALQSAQAGFRRAAIAFALQASHAGNGEQALSILQRAGTTRPADVELLRSYGIEALALRQLPLAADTLRRALSLAPDDPDSLLGLARVEMEEQHVAAADPLFRRYLLLRPMDAGGHYGFGCLLTMQQQTDAARAEFERSIQLQPAQDASYYELGQLALDAQDNTAAFAWFRKALAANPRHGGALTGTGIVQYREHNYAGAEATLRRAVQSAPDYDVAHHYLGLTLVRQNRPQEAEQEFREAMALQPKGSSLSGSTDNQTMKQKTIQ